jgi:hypothetical protein
MQASSRQKKEKDDSQEDGNMEGTRKPKQIQLDMQKAYENATPDERATINVFPQLNIEQEVDFKAIQLA